MSERLWSPKTVTDVGDARTRLLNQRCRLMTLVYILLHIRIFSVVLLFFPLSLFSRGIQAEPIGPGYCSDEWHGP